MTDTLETYGRELVAAGFEVWLTGSGRRAYLQYRDPATGCTGSLEKSDHEGWQHYMPLIPSREYGSSMFMDSPPDPFTVEAAQQAARPTNWNHVVGTRTNARDKTWRSSDAVRLHGTEVDRFLAQNKLAAATIEILEAR